MKNYFLDRAKSKSRRKFLEEAEQCAKLWEKSGLLKGWPCPAAINLQSQRLWNEVIRNGSDSQN